MPVKVVKRIDNLDNPTDGFDPEFTYQMVPFGSTREMTVETGEFRAELGVKGSTLVTAMSNFRVLVAGSRLPSSLPGPTLFVQKTVIPERSLIQFTLTGNSVGMTVIEGKDLPSGRPPAKPSFQLLVSVKRAEPRSFVICYLFDLVNRDKHVRLPLARLLNEVNDIFQPQTNFTVSNIDGGAADTLAARTLTLNGKPSRTFNMLDRKLIGRVVDAFDARFPTLFSSTHGVIFPVSVPLTAGDDRTVAINFKATRESDNRSFNLLFVGPFLNRDLTGLRHALAHEIGHSFGLTHNPEFQPPPLLRNRRNPELQTAAARTLMFPTLLVRSNRINANQIEIMHLLGPQFRRLNF